MVDSESDGEALANLDIPPPPPDAPPPPPPVDVPAAEEAKCGLPSEMMFLERADDSSWPVACCCCEDPGGENNEDEDEAEDWRLVTCRLVCEVVKAEFVGENAARDGDWPDATVLACASPVDIGGRPRRAPCCWADDDQADCCVRAFLEPDDVGELV